MAAKKGEYGKPTFARAVAARLGVGDGYGNAKKAAKLPAKQPAPPPKAERMSISNVAVTYPEAIAKRKAMLDEYKHGGKVKGKRK